jgi:hypothetical protein
MILRQVQIILNGKTFDVVSRGIGPSTGLAVYCSPGTSTPEERESVQAAFWAAEDATKAKAEQIEKAKSDKLDFASFIGRIVKE